MQLTAIRGVKAVLGRGDVGMINILYWVCGLVVRGCHRVHDRNARGKYGFRAGADLYTP